MSKRLMTTGNLELSEFTGPDGKVLLQITGPDGFVQLSAQQYGEILRFLRTKWGRSDLERFIG